MINKSNKSDTKKGDHIMSRVNTKPRNDHKVFKRTAASTKKINVAPKISRGGIRL